jgi:hypothetical protein
VLRVQYLHIQGFDAVLERSDVSLARIVLIFRFEGPKNPAIHHISKTQIVKIVKNIAVVTPNTELPFVEYSKYMLYKLLIFFILNFSEKFVEAIPLCYLINQGFLTFDFIVSSFILFWY